MFIINEKHIHDFFYQAENLVYQMNVKQGIIGYLDCNNNHFKSEFIFFEIN
jgi:hypothetical protein